MFSSLLNFPYFMREVLFNMKRNVIMTAASMSTVMILSLILGFFVVAVMNLNFWSSNILKNLQIVVYLQDHLADEDIQVLKNRIAVMPQVKSVKFVSADDALQVLRLKLGTQLELDDIGENPLPNSMEINLRDPEAIPQTAQSLKQYEGVDEVRYGENITRKLLSLNRAVRIAGFIIIVALMFATILIVSNTIRLTVYARRREISIMQLVGAANWFIRWPFILEGIAYGLTGSIAAVIVIAFAYIKFIPQIHQTMPFLMMVKPAFLIVRLSQVLIFTGVFVGMAGSWISVNKYLKNFVSRSKYYA